MQIILQNQSDFESRLGTQLLQSDPVIISSNMIQQYCRSINQLDWFHFDEERSKAAGFNGIIAPGSMTFAMVHSTFFSRVGLHNLKALFIGSNRFRVLRPLVADESITMTMNIADVTPKDPGFRVQYDFQWHGGTESDVISTGEFLVRYWPLEQSTNE